MENIIDVEDMTDEELTYANMTDSDFASKKEEAEAAFAAALAFLQNASRGTKRTLLRAKVSSVHNTVKRKAKAGTNALKRRADKTRNFFKQSKVRDYITLAFTTIAVAVTTAIILYMSLLTYAILYTFVSPLLAYAYLFLLVYSAFAYMLSSKALAI